LPARYPLSSASFAAVSDGVAKQSLGRINLRLPAETYGVIDIARAARPGNISRNSWITEAVEEKLARHRAESGELKGSEINA
jgi:predicted HicB family RNase H-like nuclease